MSAPHVYLLLTKNKVHAYGTWTRWRKIIARASRMGVDFESMQVDVRKGDPYSHHPEPREWSCYARAECSFGEGA
jgi:hypothetical protein